MVTSLVIGILAGVFSVLFGVGGGLFMVPAMVLLLAMRTQRAVGTSLAVVLPMSLFAIVQYLNVREVRQTWEWSPVVMLALGGVFGARYGAALANRLGSTPLRRVFGAAAALVGFYLAFTPDLGEGRALAHPAWYWMILAGAGVGVISGLLGIGGGLVMVPLLVTAIGYAQKTAQAISLAVIVPVALSGAILHYRAGNINLRIAAWLTVGGLLGVGIIGAKIGRIDNPTLRLMFGIFLAVVGVWMMLQPPRRSDAPAPPR